MQFNKTVQNLQRLREVIQVLLKYGFEDLVANTALRRVIPVRTNPESDKPVLAYTRWERIRMVVEELGPTFVKFAQALSNRPDLLPEALIVEFIKLQNDVPPVPTDLIRQSIKQELGKAVEEIFSVFEDKPLAAASIGQVHYAVLPTGEEVVVKVQRPDASRKITADLSLLRELVRYTEGYFKNLGLLNPLEVVDTFEKTMQKELDYTGELGNMDKFRKIYGNTPNFYIPFPYKEFSTARVLTTEYIKGCKITDVPQLEAWGLDPKKIVEKGMNIYLSQIFEHGFFHADPHPGNILVRQNGTIVLLDFGMVGKLIKSQKYAFAGVFIGLANQDPKSMAANLRRLAIDSDIPNMQLFENDMYELIENFIVFGNEDAGVADFSRELQRIIYRYKLQVPGSVFLILRALAILEGVGKAIYPQLATFDIIKPYGLKLLAEQFSFRNQRNELTYSISQVISLLYVFPAEVKSILQQIRHGDLNLNLILKGYEERSQKLDTIVNKLILTLLICTLLIVSALTIQQAYFSNFALISALILGIGLFLYGMLRRK